MKREKLLEALRRLAPETGSLCCLGCGYEHNCSLHGCAVIRSAREEIMRLAAENEAMREKLSPEDAEACRRPMSPAERDAMLDWPTRQPPNPPLTLEELREMDGEPVHLLPGGCWVLVTQNPITTVLTFPDGSQCAAKDWMSNVGKIYRRKPEEGPV